MAGVLYLTRNGLLEPLGQSQVISYLRGLSRDYRITLISYEKQEDWADADAVSRAEAECAALGIRWLPQRFHRRPKIIAPAASMLWMLWLAWRQARGGHIKLIHARSYIPAAVALAVHRLTGVPFIFDMRALWPEELITAGRLRRGSFLHRLVVRGERDCLRHAAAVVSLTHAAVDYLKRTYPDELSGRPLAVIPTCADLDRFVPAALPPTDRVYACLGTVLSGWFRLEWLTAFFEAVAEHDPQARLELVTRDDPDAVRQAMGGSIGLRSRLSISSVAPSEAHKAVQRHSVSVMFFTEGLSKLGSSPTRMAEVLGCGLPVVANAGVGDMARIVKHYRVGVLAEDGSIKAMVRAATELHMLMKDPDLAARCRTAAEEVFSLESGTKAYRNLYRDILDRSHGHYHPSPFTTEAI